MWCARHQSLLRQRCQRLMYFLIQMPWSGYAPRCDELFLINHALYCLVYELWCLTWYWYLIKDQKHAGGEFWYPVQSDGLLDRELTVKEIHHPVHNPKQLETKFRPQASPPRNAPANPRSWRAHYTPHACSTPDAHIQSAHTSAHWNLRQLYTLNTQMPRS